MAQELSDLGNDGDPLAYMALRLVSLSLPGRLHTPPAATSQSSSDLAGRSCSATYPGSGCRLSASPGFSL